MTNDFKHFLMLSFNSFVQTTFGGGPVPSCCLGLVCRLRRHFQTITRSTCFAEGQKSSFTLAPHLHLVVKYNPHQLSRFYGVPVICLSDRISVPELRVMDCRGNRAEVVASAQQEAVNAAGRRPFYSYSSGKRSFATCQEQTEKKT